MLRLAQEEPESRRQQTCLVLGWEKHAADMHDYHSIHDKIIASFMFEDIRQAITHDYTMVNVQGHQSIQTVHVRILECNALPVPEGEMQRTSETDSACKIT